MSPKIFSVSKRTIIEEIIGGSGPNPSDAFSLNIRFPDTIAALVDAMSVAFTFPDTIAAQTEAVRIAVSVAEENGVPTDLLTGLGITHSDTIGALTEALRLAIAFSDTVAGQTETTKVDIRGLGDTNAALSDLLTQLGLTHADTISLPTDASTYALNFTTSDTVSAETDALTRLRISGFGDTNALPTDAQRGTATWLQGATTAAGANWSTPASAQGLRNNTLSTLSDTATTQPSGTLTLDPYPDPDASFSSWTISTVKLRFFVKGVFSALTTSTLKLEWRIGAGAWTTLETLSTNFDNLAAGSPRIHDVTAGVGGSWANVNGLQTRAVYTAAVLVETATIDVDAVEIEVVATKNPI